MLLNQYIDSEDQILLNIYKQHSQQQKDKENAKRSITSLCWFLSQFDFAPFQNGIEFMIFGSFTNEFGSNNSDVDFTLLSNSYVDERMALKYIEQEIKSVDQKKFKVNELVEFARIAVMKVTDLNRNVEIDICFNNILGVINSKLLKAYAEINPIIKQGGLLIKLWGKKEGIINKSCFSSYAMIIMWIHFLQKKFNLPNLQDQKYNERKISSKINIKRNIEDKPSQFEVDTFFICKGRLFENLCQKFKDGIENVSLKQLLKEFFIYYSDDQEGFNQKYKISINLVELKDENVKYSMSDPFDIEHDPIKKVRNSFNKQKIFNEAAKRIDIDIKSLF